MMTQAKLKLIEFISARPQRYIACLLGIGFTLMLQGCDRPLLSLLSGPNTPTSSEVPPPKWPNGRPRLHPLPAAQEIWECEVAVIGGSLGGISAASHGMQSGATTCLIEVAPWLGGQISAQGVSAVDESLAMRAKQNFSPSWQAFKQLISQQSAYLPALTGLAPNTIVERINRCWVGHLCFPPQAGADAAEALLRQASQAAPDSQWGSAIAFKGAEFSEDGRSITAIYGVRRIPRQPDYVPQGRLSQEITAWYSWSADDEFEKVPIKLQPPPGRSLMVIDATDTGELVGWAGLPHRLGSESRATTGEVNGSDFDNPDCTQAFTYPFAVAIANDEGRSLEQLSKLKTTYKETEHQKDFGMENFPFFSGRSFFHYRRIVSTTGNDPFTTTPAMGDITMVNWNRGNDWSWMNPPLILTAEQVEQSGQQQNWLGGISAIALGHGEDHALLFARWLLENKAQPNFPLTYLAGAQMPMGTGSGLSMTPYIREGRRILGRAAHGQDEFMMREADLRTDVPGGRDFTASTVAVTHYDIDIHGCRYRNWEASGEATSAPAREFVVRPTQIPLASLIPQGVDNVLIGGKTIAVTHIVNAVTRVHYSEWGIGGAAGAIAGWLVTNPAGPEMPAQIETSEQMPALQQHLKEQGLRLNW